MHHESVQQTTPNQSSSSSPHTDLNALPQSFQAISLKDGGFGPDFVGGFNPTLVSSTVPRHAANAKQGPLPQPPKNLLTVASPQGNYSRTMQYALSGELSSHREPEINVTLAPINRQRMVSAPPPSPSNDLANSIAEPKERRASVGASPRIQQQTQCAAFTKAGKQCTRQVKLKTSLQGSDEEGGPTPRYCFQHIKEINSSTGFYARKNGVWIDYKGTLLLRSSYAISK